MRETESIAEYLARLVSADEQRIRLHPEYADPAHKGNIIVAPVLMLGKDTNDDYRPAKMDTEGRLDVVGVVPTHQPNEFLDQGTPGSGTKYEVLPETELVRIYTIGVRCGWTVQPTPLEVHLTIDGQSITFTGANPGNNQWLQCYFSAYNAGGIMGTAGNIYYRSYLIEGRSVKIEAEITGGTVSSLLCRVKWARW